MILELELEKVPIESAAGTCDIGSKAPNIGINIKPGPPPQSALSENARNAHKKMMVKLDIEC